MKVCDEMQEAIDFVINDLNETEEFKKQFKNLIYNYYKGSVANETIQRVLEQVQFDEV